MQSPPRTELIVRNKEKNNGAGYFFFVIHQTVDFCSLAANKGGTHTHKLTCLHIIDDGNIHDFKNILR